MLGAPPDGSAAPPGRLRHPAKPHTRTVNTSTGTRPAGAPPGWPVACSGRPSRCRRARRLRERQRLRCGALWLSGLVPGGSAEDHQEALAFVGRAEARSGKPVPVDAPSPRNSPGGSYGNAGGAERRGVAGARRAPVSGSLGSRGGRNTGLAASVLRDRPRCLMGWASVGAEASL